MRRWLPFEWIAAMRFLFELGNMEQLSVVLARVRALDGVFSADRMMPATGSGH